MRVLSRTSSFTRPFAAGWSSPVARQAHNLKVAGSNPAPAPKLQKALAVPSGGFLPSAARHAPARRRATAPQRAQHLHSIPAKRLPAPTARRKVASCRLSWAMGSKASLKSRSSAAGRGPSAAPLKVRAVSDRPSSLPRSRRVSPEARFVTRLARLGPESRAQFLQAVPEVRLDGVPHAARVPGA
jgi:hypothetical protein